jgi:hypothetical protein
MQFPGRTTMRTGFAAVGALTLLCLACKDSNAVTAPVSSPMAAANVSGTWTGTFTSDSDACGISQITATLQQSGSQVTGNISGTSCGPSGFIKGSVSGNQLTGSIEMLGCKGGGVSATVNGSALSLSVGDLTKPLVTGERVVMYGGSASLRR